MDTVLYSAPAAKAKGSGSTPQPRITHAPPKSLEPDTAAATLAKIRNATCYRALRTVITVIFMLTKISVGIGMIASLAAPFA